MQIVVVGPGAMGTLFAGLLALGGHHVWLLGRRPEVVEAITWRGGVAIEIESGIRRTAEVLATLDAAEAGPAELILMAAKAYDTARASQDVLPAVGPDTMVLTLQNGLGNVEAIASVVGRDRVLAGTTAYGATLLGPGLVRHAGKGDTVVGELDGRETERLRGLVAAFGQAGISVEISHSVEQLLWSKVVVNAAINPITALLRVRNGQLLDSEDSRELLRVAAAEAAAVAVARGIHLPYSDPVERVETVCRLTAANRSSMLQDLERGEMTEIDYINGVVVREGEDLGVPTPVNWVLTRLIRGIQSKGRER